MWAGWGWGGAFHPPPSAADTAVQRSQILGKFDKDFVDQDASDGRKG